MHTIVLELLRRGVPASTEGIAIAIDSMSPDDVAARLRDLVAAGPADAFSLAASVENKSGAKHHAFLGAELLSADYASSDLDTMGAHEVLVSVVRAC